MLAEQNTAAKHERVKVLVKCQSCGQRFIMRGVPNKEGDIETGFKRCMCGNADVEITAVERSVPNRLGYRLKNNDDSEVI
ncbi:hypothetical protein AN477_10530 [Alicyclobacillus ferrooxydans]|uniref:Uncharacterized protein n=1 Tax=Alicyclobacillus ferrooxydans TaxID=471514 RepID=A0A0P9D2R5_9BACL|nr:hypothetical protein AN477_10530 [Alicyclobacillus ferrooxydans]